MELSVGGSIFNVNFRNRIHVPNQNPLKRADQF